MGTMIKSLFPRLLRLQRAQILMYSVVHCGFPRDASLYSKKYFFFQGPQK